MDESDDAVGSAFVSPDDGVEPFGGQDFYVQIRAKELFRLALERGQLMTRVEELESQARVRAAHEKLMENLPDG